MSRPSMIHSRNYAVAYQEIGRRGMGAGAFPTLEFDQRRANEFVNQRMVN